MLLECIIFVPAMGNAPGMIGFFEEAPGQKSMLRLMSFMCLCFAFLMVLIELAERVKALSLNQPMPPVDSNFLWLIVIFICGAFCPKVIQKLIEMKFNLPADKSAIQADAPAKPTGA